MELTFNLGDFVARTKLILKSPAKAFDKIEKEKGVNKALSYYIALTLISVVLGILFTYIVVPLLIPIFPDTLVSPEPLSVEGLINILVIYLVDVILSFVVGGILFLWLKVFRGKREFAKAYQLYVYSQTPNMLLRVFPYLSLVGWIYSMYLLMLGTVNLYKLTWVKAVLMYIIPLAMMYYLAINFTPAV